jgi:signal transduction histidine kinase
VARRASSAKWLDERPELVLDLLIAGVLTAVMQVEVWFHDGQDETFANRPLSSPLMAAATISLAWRRRAPLAVAAIVSGALATQALATGTFTSGFGILFTFFVALYSVGAYAEGARRLFGLALIAAANGVRHLEGAPYSETDNWVAAFFYVLELLVFSAGAYVGSRRRSRRLAEVAGQLEREQDERARAAVAEERTRIARELHDVVAHDVSAALVQAEAAEELLDSEPDRARASLRTVQRASREALTEMRRLVSILRADGANAPLAPHPGVSDLGTLVERAREAGLAVELVIEGAPRELPPGVDFSGFRIVQEALTNVRKHAGTAKARVSIRYLRGALEVEIVDDGRGVTPGDGGGHGLVGMRERVTFFGGEFSAEPGDEGGFSVRARFPLAPVES